VSAIYKYNYDLKNKGFLLFYDLNKLEIDDKFYYCENNQKCLDYFKEDNLDSNLLLIIQNRKKFLRIENYEENFKDLIKIFSKFRNPFFIGFGDEFKKKVLDEMIPTLILITEYNEENEKDIISFKENAKKFKNNMHATLILKNEFSNNQKALYDRLQNTLGFDETDEFPMVIFLEPNLETMKLNQYRLSLSSQSIEEFLELLFRGQVKPFVKSEKLKETIYENFELLNGNNIEQKVHNDKQESIILIHKGIQNDNESRAYYNFFKKIRDMTRFNSFKYYLINGIKNDVPFFLNKLPSFVVFSNNNWKYPIVFNEHSQTLQKFIDVLDKRKELIIHDEDFKLEDIENIFTEL
jgi:hypothetical protein